MCGLQFFGQVTVRCVRILDRIVRKRRAAAKRFYQIPSCIRVSLTGLRVKDLIKRAALIIGQGVFYFR